MDKIKAWFMTFLFGLQAAWNVVIHQPVIEPVLELLVKQRILIAIIAFAAGVYIPQIQGIAPGMADLLVLGVITFAGYLIHGLQKEVEIELRAANPPNRQELEAIIQAAIKAFIAGHFQSSLIDPASLDRVRLPVPEKFTQVG